MENSRDHRKHKHKKTSKGSSSSVIIETPKKHAILEKLGLLIIENRGRLVTNEAACTQTDHTLRNIKLGYTSGEESMTTEAASERTSNLDVRSQKPMMNLNKGYIEKNTLTGHIVALEDEIDVFFRSLAMTVRTFPPLLRTQTKSKLFQIIAEAEMQTLMQPPFQTPTDMSLDNTSLAQQ